MAESPREYNPKVSEYKRIHKSSVIGESKTTKFPRRVQPPLVRCSAHLFASWKTWLILTWWSWWRRYLQSLSKEEYELLEGLLDWTRSTITLASNSLWSWGMPSWVASIRPSLNAHSSAVMLVATQCASYTPWPTSFDGHVLNHPHLPCLGSQERFHQYSTCTTQGAV